MRLRDYLQRELVFTISPGPSSKPELLEQLARLVGERVEGLDPAQLVARLAEREGQISTGIGHGVAIPHATLDGLAAPVCVIVQVPGGCDYGALDQSPVCVLFLLLSPPEQTGHHIRLLARIARLVDDRSFVEKLARAADPEAIYELAVAEDGRHV